MSCNFFLVQPRMWDWEGQPLSSHCCKHRYSNSEESDTERFTYSRYYGRFPSRLWSYHQLRLAYVPAHAEKSSSILTHSSPQIPCIQASNRVLSQSRELLQQKTGYYLFIFSLNIGWLLSWCTCSNLAHITDALDTTNLLA